MDQDSIPQQFVTLEKKVEQLVQKCNNLQNSKSGLEAKVRDLEEALSAKNATEQGYMQEKSMIRSKMDNLVGRLDKALGSA